jgi:hypothetical protein
MKVETFDKIAASAVISSAAFTVSIAVISWDWFPTPGDWGDIARIPGSIENYLALLLPPTLVLCWLLVRRLHFVKGSQGSDGNE